MRNIPQQVVTGDDVEIVHFIRDEGEPLAIDPEAVVTSRLVTLERDAAYTDEVAQVSTDGRSDWTGGKVLVKIPRAQTAAITFQGIALLETQVFQNDVKITRFQPVEIVRGQIA